MKLLMSYVIQGESQHWFDSEIVDLKLVPPLYNTESPEKEMDFEIVRWLKMKQSKLKAGEKIVLLNTLKF